MSNYKTRYIQSCFNVITYEQHNLEKFLSKEVAKPKRNQYRLNQYEKHHLTEAIKNLERSLLKLKNFKGIED